MAIGFIWPSHWCHILDSGIVRDFQVDLVLAVICALNDTVVVSIVGCIVGSAIESELSLVPFSLVIDDRSAILGTMIYMPLFSFPVSL
jgi:hypothetical protein